MKRFIKSNLWVISAVLYPLSWVTYSGPNLSFLAWIAFVPLFIYLSEQTAIFRRFYGSGLAVITSWTIVAAGWLFLFPMDKWLVAIAFISGTLHISFPFILLFFLQKKLSFPKSLLLFPFIWVAWEWIYLLLPHMMVTHPLPYGQGDNLWLIQMADLGGMWLISFWVMLFNVLIYLAVRKHNYNLGSMAFLVSGSKVSAAMILPPLLYCGFIFQNSNLQSDKSVQVSIVPTQFEPNYLTDQKNQKTIIEQTLHRTDSLAYDLASANKNSDLYVWPEAGTSYWMAFENINTLLHQATTDWRGSLITGSQEVRSTGEHQDQYVSGVLITPQLHDVTTPVQYHHKIALVPGSETIPYHDILSVLFPSLKTSKKNYTYGNSFEPLQLLTKDNEIFQTGVSLCYEQWFPSIWTKQVQNGAEFFVHMAAEGWYGDKGFAQFMANVSRFRAVENRRSVARSSNMGLSMFINAYGQSYKKINYGSLDMVTAEVSTSKKMTLFSRHPNLFPKFCLYLITFSLVYFFVFSPSSQQ